MARQLVCKRCGAAENEEKMRDVIEGLCSDCACVVFYREQMRFERREAWRALGRLICRRAVFAEDYPVSRWRKVAYFGKVAICLLLHRRGSLDYRNEVEVVCQHSASLYAGWESRTLCVGRGPLNWRYDVQQDGDWWM